MSETKYKLPPDDARFTRQRFRLGAVCCQLCRFAAMDSKESYCQNCVITNTIHSVFNEISDIARLKVLPDSENGCELCNLKPVFDEDGDYEYWDSQKELAHGVYTFLYISANESGSLVLRASGEDLTADYPISFCPKCGRKLQTCTDKGEKAL